MLEKLVVMCLLTCMVVAKIGQSYLRYCKYMDAVASNCTSLDPQKLPPIERAAYIIIF